MDQQPTTHRAYDHFSDARAVSTPLVVYISPDAPASQMGLLERITADEREVPDNAKPGKTIQQPPPPAVAWDVIRGLHHLNPQGQEAVASLRLQQAQTVNLSIMLDAAIRLPARTLLFLHNAHLYWEGQGRQAFLQGILNLREPFKTNFRSLVLIYPGGRIPMDLERDVVPIEEPLPGPGQLGDMVKALHKGAGLDEPSPEVLAKATSALAGLSIFTAEQNTAMSLRRRGLDMDALRSRARQQINNTPGLSVWAGGETFDGLGGLDNVKRFCRLIADGNDRPNCIVFMDEVEKQIAGYGTDTSGVAGYQMGRVLQDMADTRATGFISYGQPGTGKSEIAKALARELDTFVMRVDLGAMKGSLVGESEARTIQALRLINAVAQGRALWVATSNGLVSLPSELKSRFTLGTFFFDLPTEAEREVIWAVHMARYPLTKGQVADRPNDVDWTGREIAACCRNAYALKLTLRQAADYIVPIALADMEGITQRRREAHGRYISASVAGAYRMPGLTGEDAGRAVLPSTRAVPRALAGMKES